MPSLDLIFAEFRHAVRGLWRDKLLTSAALAAFALCVAANVVVFSVVHAVLLQSPGWPAPGELVNFSNGYSKLPFENDLGSSVPNYYERRSLAAVSDVAAIEVRTALVGGAEAPLRATIGLVTPSFFTILGVKPALGRLFTEEDVKRGRTDVAVLSDGHWRAQYGADPQILGRTIRLNNEPVTVIGVMPPEFHYFADRTSLWRPLIFSAQERDVKTRHWNVLTLIGRLSRGTSLATAQAQVDAQNAALSATDPEAAWAKASGFHTRVQGLRDVHVASVRPALLLLECGAALLLLIGLVNVQNLLLVRATARAKEIAVRQVLGASGRIIALGFLFETTLLAVAGGLLGLGLAADALPILIRVGLDRLTLGAVVRINAPVVECALGAVLVLGVALAAPLIMFNRRSRLGAALGGESRGGTASRSTLRLRNGLVVAQIALAFVLLTGAALLGESFRRLLGVDPGIRAPRVLSSWIGLTSQRYEASAERFHFATRWVEAMKTLPGIESVAVGTALPLDKPNWFQQLTVEGHVPKAGDHGIAHNVVQVMGDYFGTLGVPLIEGRTLTADDALSPRRVCVVDQAFAERYWPHASALGRWVAFDNSTGQDRMTIVGVVGVVKYRGLTEVVPSGTLYFPLRPDAAETWISTLVRTAQSPEGTRPALRRVLQQLDPEMPLNDIRTMDALIADSSRPQRSLMLLSTLFAGLALLLAGVGIYGVMAFTVAQKQKEVGIRMALGALPADILRQFLGLGGRLLLAGTVAGAVAAWFGAGALRGLLFGISPAAPLAYAGTGLALAVITMVACVVPSLRAAAVSMTEALKHD